MTGLERPGTRSPRPAGDYVTRAPGALVTPRSGERARDAMSLASERLLGGAGATLCGPCRRSLEGAWATLCGPCRPIALGTLRNGQNRSFPCFPCFPCFLADSGGPSLPSEPVMTERRKVARMATLRLFVIWRPLGTLDPDGSGPSGTPTPGRLNRPVLAGSGLQACILLVLRKLAVLVFS